MQNSNIEGDASRLTERRSQARHRLILRVGVLEQYGKSSLCLVKNISSSGVQLKCYARPVVEGYASIRVADEAPVRGQIVWLDGDVAGMSFDCALSAEALLRVRQKLKPQRRRSTPRVDVDASACLRTGGRICRAVVCDISSMGARIRTTSRLMPGDRAIVTLSDLPALEAYVRWTSGDEAGLVFETPIPMQVIGSMAASGSFPEIQDWMGGSRPAKGLASSGFGLFLQGGMLRVSPMQKKTRRLERRAFS